MENSEIIAASAAFISLLALATTFWQAHLSRKHNKLSVKPHLISGHNLSQRADNIKYILKNTGLGPAIITYFAAVVDGVHYSFDSITHPNEVNQLFGRLGINLEGMAWELQSHGNNSSIPAGDEEVILGFYDLLKDEESYSTLKNVLPRLKFSIKYECMYGNKYSIEI